MNAAVANEPLTRSVEDYLKAIYQLSPEGRAASTSEIANLLALSAPSVTGMVKRLSEHGLLEHVPYRGVQLTDEGLGAPECGSPRGPYTCGGWFHSRAGLHSALRRTYWSHGGDK